jgi:hypothetical protein
VSYRSLARKEIYVATNFRATVAVARSNETGAYLGVAWPEKAWTIQTNSFAQNGALLFDFDLTGEQLALIEGLRCGGDLVFTLKVHCEVGNGQDIVAGEDEIRYNVNSSGWIATMKQFGVDRLIVLEVELPKGGADLESAVSLLRRARGELDAGNYDGVVQQSRRAIESVEKALKLSDEIKAAMERFSRGDRKGMSKRARSLVVNEAALHYTHPAHHVDEDGAAFKFGRRDAAFMLALASAVVSNATAFRDAPQQAE